MSGAALERYESGGNRRRVVGWSVVGGLHVLVAYGLVSGTARQALDAVKKPLEAVVIQEVIIPPPLPPPPPPPPPPRELPRTPPPPAPRRAEPPPYVPPAEVAPPAAAPAIAASPVPQAPPPAPPAPPPPPPAPAVERAEMSVVCPTQVKPEMPRRAAREGASGVVRAQASIVGGAVREVRILSGPSVFHAAVREAMLQYKCNGGGTTEVLATQEFVFRVE